MHSSVWFYTTNSEKKEKGKGLNMENYFTPDCTMQYVYEEYTLLEAVVERDIEAVQAILDDNPTEEELNERDRSGRTALSHACSSGLLPVVEMLSEIPEVDVNIPDKEGNTPIIFAAQAGHTEIVKTLINDFRKIKIDQKNRAGMTALIKAAIQGRPKCAKTLLYAGANPKIRDNSRRFTAEEWARYCGRKECAEEIARFTNTKCFLFSSMHKKSIRRSNSVPDLVASKEQSAAPPIRAKSRSFKRTIKKFLPGHVSSAPLTANGVEDPLAMVARCVSTPILPDAISKSMMGSLKRPISADNIPKVKVTVAEKNDVG